MAGNTQAPDVMEKLTPAEIQAIYQHSGLLKVETPTVRNFALGKLLVRKWLRCLRQLALVD